MCDGRPVPDIPSHFICNFIDGRFFSACSGFVLRQMKSFSRFPGEGNFFSSTIYSRDFTLGPNWIVATSSQLARPDQKQCQIEKLSLPLKRLKAKFSGARRRKANNHGSGKNVESKFLLASVYVFSKNLSKQNSSFWLLSFCLINITLSVKHKFSFIRFFHDAQDWKVVWKTARKSSNERG